MSIASLPVVNNRANEYTRYFHLNNTEETSKLRFFIKMYVGSDCWAVTVNNKVVFESFSEKSVRDKILDDTVRDAIIDNPHASLLCDIIRQKKNATIRIYMFGSYGPYTLNIKYFPDRDRFQVSKLWSTMRSNLPTNEEDDEAYKAGEY